MIAEVSNRDFLLAAAKHTRLSLNKVVEQRERRELGNDKPLAYSSVKEVDDASLAYFSAEGIDDELLAEFSAEQIREVIDELDRAYRELESERGQNSPWMCVPSIPILAICKVN